MKGLATSALASVSAGVLALGLAGPAMASNEVKVKIDPLNWQWSGQLDIRSDPAGVVPFTVQPGGGPQQVYNADVGLTDSLRFFLENGTMTAPNGEVKTPVEVYAMLSTQIIGPMSHTLDEDPRLRATDEDVRLTYSFRKQTDPADDKDFYELKFFPLTEAPTGPPTDLALQNLHEKQSDGVDSCDVAQTLSPGDELTTGDANDTVCVTLEDGDGSSDAAIIIDTGDGNDTVLIDGDTGANVEVDTGRGNDVVVVDSDADVSVDAGEGHDSVVAPDQATVTGGDGTDLIVIDGRTAPASVGDVQCELNGDGSLQCDDWTIISG